MCLHVLEECVCVCVSVCVREPFIVFSSCLISLRAEPVKLNAPLMWCF